MPCRPQELQTTKWSRGSDIRLRSDRTLAIDAPFLECTHPFFCSPFFIPFHNPAPPPSTILSNPEGSCLPLPPPLQALTLCIALRCRALQEEYNLETNELRSGAGWVPPQSTDYRAAGYQAPQQQYGGSQLPPQSGAFCPVRRPPLQGTHSHLWTMLPLGPQT